MGPFPPVIIRAEVVAAAVVLELSGEAAVGLELAEEAPGKLELDRRDAVVEAPAVGDAVPSSG